MDQLGSICSVPGTSCTEFQWQVEQAADRLGVGLLEPEMSSASKPRGAITKGSLGEPRSLALASSGVRGEPHEKQSDTVTASYFHEGTPSNVVGVIQMMSTRGSLMNILSELETSSLAPIGHLCGDVDVGACYFRVSFLKLAFSEPVIWG